MDGDEVLETDFNSHSLFSCATQGEDVEEDGWRKGFLSFLLVLTALIC